MEEEKNCSKDKETELWKPTKMLTEPLESAQKRQEVHRKAEPTATPAAWLCVRVKGEQKCRTKRSQVAVVKRERAACLPGSPQHSQASDPDAEFVGAWWEGQKCRGIWIGVSTSDSGQWPDTLLERSLLINRELLWI